MAIHSSGAISFQDLINEFKVPKPISLSQMYAGGAYVPTSNTGVPKSGAISLGNFYGAASTHVINYNITADMFNFNSSTVIANSNWDGVTPLILTVNIAAGIVVSGNSTSTPAFVVNALPSGSQVIINNNGYIIGMGGAGAGASGAGQAGGTALQTLTPITLNNVGTIGGGGGGGGGRNTLAVGGGGRSGRLNSASGGNGKAGTFSSAGAGGIAGGSRGGNGGDWGAAGQPAPSGSNGGAGGAAVRGNNLITWVSLGTIKGSRIN